MPSAPKHSEGPSKPVKPDLPGRRRAGDRRGGPRPRRHDPRLPARLVRRPRVLEAPGRGFRRRLPRRRPRPGWARRVRQGPQGVDRRQPGRRRRDGGQGAGFKHVILVGHSMGGPVALLAAKRVPGTVIAVIGVDTLQNAEFKLPEEVRSRSSTASRRISRGRSG